MRRRRLVRGLVGAFLVVVASGVGADPGAATTWETRAALVAPAQQAVAVAHGGLVYLLGNGTGSSFVGIQAYDPVADDWVEPPAGGWDPMLVEPWVNFGAAAVDGKIYVAGGFVNGTTPTARFDVYDIATNAWTHLGSLPGGTRWYPAVGAIGTKVYVAGGSATGGSPMARLDVYDTATSTWSTGPDLPEPVWQAPGVVAGGRFWVMGGQIPATIRSDVVQVFTPSEGGGSWALNALPMPTGRFSSGAAAVGDRYVVVVGGDSYPAAYVQVEALDTTTGAWHVFADLPVERWRPAVASFETGPGTADLFAMGGMTPITGLAESTAYALSFEHGETPPPPPPPPGDTTPPTITGVTPSVAVLWPPNSKMVSVGFDVVATDDSGDPVTCAVVDVESDEDEGADADWAVVGDLAVSLRAQRDGTGDGRVYTIWVVATDEAGNATDPFAVEVAVPHDQD